MPQSFDDFITAKRSASKKPNAGIAERWAKRVVPRGLHHQGRAGAQQYLRDYGRGISAAKVIALALQAESEGCADMAIGFWSTAYTLETRKEPSSNCSISVAFASPSQSLTSAPSPSRPSVPGLPDHLQPGRIITQQPVDASHPREHYVNDSAYIGQPKRDGNRIVIVATADGVWYQSRSTVLQSSPDSQFDVNLRAVALKQGTFVLDGEKVHLDVLGGEHRTGAQAAQANAEAGQPSAPVVLQLSIFKALYAKGVDLTATDEGRRITLGHLVTKHLMAALLKSACPNLRFEAVPVAATTAEKKALAARQQAEGREGEVWLRRTVQYLGGKSNDGSVVRTKYLTETEVVVTALTPTTVKGRAFGAIEVSEVLPDGSMKSVGAVGTGFSQTEATELASRFAATPGQLRIIVRHQGRTENGQLWHARFVGYADNAAA